MDAAMTPNPVEIGVDYQSHTSLFHHPLFLSKKSDPLAHPDDLQTRFIGV